MSGFRISDKYRVEYIISLDNWINLDDNEKSKLSVFKTIFNQNTDISKEIPEKYYDDKTIYFAIKAR